MTVPADSPSSSPADILPSRPTVLVVEDDCGLRESLVELLEGEGFSCVSAGDGGQALELLRTHPVDLVICDVLMQPVDGWTLARRLREEPEWANLPFVFLTALSGGQNSRQAMREGADAYLVKPCPFDQVLEAVNAKLERRNALNRYVESRVRRAKEAVVGAIGPEFASLVEAIVNDAEVVKFGASTGAPGRVADPWLAQAAASVVSDARDALRIARNAIARVALMSLFPGDQPLIATGPSTTDTSELESLVVRPIAASYGREDVEVEILPRVLPTPERALCTALAQIVDNAFRYTKMGSVVRVRGLGEGRSYRIVVSDNGPGMIAARINASLSGGVEDIQPGQPSGLIIAKAALQAVGAELQLESRISHGVVASIVVNANQGLSGRRDAA